MSFVQIPPDSEEICAICTEFLEDDVWAHLNIHRFHGRCIKEWVADKYKPTCPLCRDIVDTTSLLGEKVLVEVKTPEPESNGLRYLIGSIAVLGGYGLYFHFRDRGT